MHREEVVSARSKGERKMELGKRPVEWCQEQRVGLEDAVCGSAETRGMAFGMNS